MFSFVWWLCLFCNLNKILFSELVPAHLANIPYCYNPHIIPQTEDNNLSEIIRTYPPHLLILYFSPSDFFCSFCFILFSFVSRLIFRTATQIGSLWYILPGQRMCRTRSQATTHVVLVVVVYLFCNLRSKGVTRSRKKGKKTTTKHHTQENTHKKHTKPETKSASKKQTQHTITKNKQKKTSNKKTTT